MAFLGMAPLLYAVRVLSSHRRSRRLHHRQPDLGDSRAATGRGHLDRAAHRRVPGLVHHVPAFDIRPAEGSRSDQPHLQRHGWRLLGRTAREPYPVSNDRTFHDAKRLYLEQYGDPMVTNTYLKIALVLVSLVAIGLALVDLRTIRTFQNFRPLVIRIDDLGRAEAINYHN